jgi:hypothetical protein
MNTHRRVLRPGRRPSWKERRTCASPQPVAAAGSWPRHPGVPRADSRAAACPAPAPVNPASRVVPVRSRPSTRSTGMPRRPRPARSHPASPRDASAGHATRERDARKTANGWPGRSTSTVACPRRRAPPVRGGTGCPRRRNIRPAPLSANPWRPGRSIRPRAAAWRLPRRHCHCAAPPYPGSAKGPAGHPADRAPFGCKRAMPRYALRPASRLKRRSPQSARQRRPGTRKTSRDVREGPKGFQESGDQGALELQGCARSFPHGLFAVQRMRELYRIFRKKAIFAAQQN